MRTLHEKLDSLERRARGGNARAERVLWQFLTTGFKGQFTTVRRGQQAGKLVSLADMVPAMYEAWRTGRTIHAILASIKMGEWVREDSREAKRAYDDKTKKYYFDVTQEDFPEDFIPVATEDKVKDTLDTLIELADLSEDEQLHVELERSGYTQSEIAARLNLAQSTVSERFAKIILKIQNSTDKLA